MTERNSKTNALPKLRRPEDLAAEMFPAGGVTGYTLRQAIRDGSLNAYLIGGAYYLSDDDVNIWLGTCRGRNRHRGFGSAKPPVAPLSGASSTAANVSARAALKTITKGLRNG